MTSTQRKVFTADLQVRRNSSNGSQDHDVQGGDLMDAIRVLTAQLGSVGKALAGEGDGTGKETQILYIEIARMVRSIGRTKMEIAAIKHPKADDDRLMLAADQLDAIVGDTEKATHDILGAGEEISNLLGDLRENAKGNKKVAKTAKAIEEKLTTILEACNFQDITGQRITKVVNTVKFIEDRVKAIIGEMGAESFEDLPVPENLRINEDDHLLNGPQLENEGLEQADIDALFD